MNQLTLKPLREVRFSFKRETFIWLFLLLVLMLVFMPLVNTFNDLLTRFIISLDAYKYIRNYVAPFEARLVGVLLWPFGFAPRIVGEYLAIGKKGPLLIEIAWNCVGWQSLVLFLLTVVIILQGNRYALPSKIKTLIIGLLGTFLVNILRITAVALLAYYFSQSVALIFHDYGSNLAVIVWLFIFWWFAHEYVLEEKEEIIPEEVTKKTG